MKKKLPYALAGLMLLCLLCTACGGDPSLQDDPNDGLGGGVSEDTVNDFSDFEGIWLGEANNDYDYMEFDADGNWALYLSGEAVDGGHLRLQRSRRLRQPHRHGGRSALLRRLRLL